EGSSIRIPERPVVDEKERLYSRYTIVSPGYFSAIGTSLLRGRDFLESDDADTLPVVIINSAMAKKFWNGNAIGKQVELASLRFPLMTIVGVVADVKRLSLREQPGPEMYVPFTQKPYPSMLKMQVVLRTATDPATVNSSARDAIHSVDSGLPVARVTTLATLVENSMAQPRFSMLLFGAFGLLSLALASIGMYGVFSYSVAQRIQEIGVRMALGAQRRNIFKMVLRQGMQLAG